MGNACGSGGNANFALLEDSEKKIICQTWPLLSTDDSNIITAAWIRAVESSIEIKDVFKIGEDEEATSNESFNNLTKEVEAFFKRIIVHMKLDEDKLIEACQTLGASHISYVSRGFRSAYWDVFMVCLIEAVETLLPYKGKKRSKVLFAWQKFTNIVVENMKVGFGNR